MTNAGDVIRIDLFYKLAPATGTVETVATGGAGTDFTVAGTMTFKGVAQTNTFNTAGTGQATSTNADVATLASAVGEVGVYCGAGRDGAVDTTATADATSPVSLERYEEIHNSVASLTGFGYTEDGAATSIDMRVDLNQSVQWASAAVSMRPLVTRRPIPPIFFQ